MRGPAARRLAAALPLVLATAALLMLPAEAARASGPSTGSETGLFLDGLIPPLMRDHHVPGLVVAVVAQGRVVLTRGYGVASPETGAPIVPERTRFPVGSLSKVVTAAAVMRLVEAGRIGLHDDVRTWIQDVPALAAIPGPLRVEHLLTHTGGFDERNIGIFARSPGAVVPLGRYLATRMPPQVMPAGTLINYSTHGMALAGRLVEVVTGRPFASYVEERILRPLGMARSSFVPPSPTDPDLASGYEYRWGRWRRLPHVYLNPGPSGGLVTTASDMTRFMMARLGDGALDGARILRPETVAMLDRQRVTHAPRLPGATLDLFERFENGERGLEHGGAWIGFYSHLFLLPARGVGLFLSYTAFEPELGDTVISRFLDHYYPAPPRAEAPVPPGFRPGRLAGRYRLVRYAHRTLEKARTLAQQVRVTATTDGVIMDDPTESDEPTRWVAVAPDFLVRADGKDFLAWRTDGHGGVTHLFIRDNAYERLAWYEGVPVQLALAATLVLVLLSGLVAGPLGWWSRSGADEPATARFARWCAGLACALHVGFLLALPATLLGLGEMEFLFGMPRTVAALLTVPVLAALPTAGLVVALPMAWGHPGASRRVLLHQALIALAALAYLADLHAWNLLGLHY